MPLINVWVNPLKWLEADPEMPLEAEPTPASLVDYLASPDVEGGFDSLLARYQQIAALQDPLFAVPAEQNILQKLVWPLRHAKGNYALGNYLGCIGLCGMVGEMVAILLWDISKPSLRGGPMDEPAQRALLGSSFEKLGQQRRTQVLEALNLIDQDSVTAFDGLRDIRRRYLHLFSQDHAHVANDALRAYEYALAVVAGVLGSSVSDERALLRPGLMAYLEEHGLVDTGDKDDTNGEQSRA